MTRRELVCLDRGRIAVKLLVPSVFVLASAFVSLAAQAGAPVAKPLSPNVVMMQAAFRITGPGKRQRRQEIITGTGFLVETSGGGNYVAVTAAHVLRDITGNTATFFFQRPSPVGGYQRVILPMTIRQNGHPAWTELPGVDIAVMSVPLSKAGVTAIPFGTLATDDDMRPLEVGDAVHALGYPFGYEFNEFPAMRSGVLASYPLAPAAVVKLLVVDFTAVGGDSGGPVYISSSGTEGGQPDRSFKVLGVVTQQVLSPDRAQNTGLAFVTPAEFVRKTIELLPALAAAR